MKPLPAACRLVIGDRPDEAAAATLQQLQLQGQQLADAMAAAAEAMESDTF